MRKGSHSIDNLSKRCICEGGNTVVEQQLKRLQVVKRFYFLSKMVATELHLNANRLEPVKS